LGRARRFPHYWAVRQAEEEDQQKYRGENFSLMKPDLAECVTIEGYCCWASSRAHFPFGYPVGGPLDHCPSGTSCYHGCLQRVVTVPAADVSVPETANAAMRFQRTRCAR